jgi:hypothetical protein
VVRWCLLEDTDGEEGLTILFVTCSSASVEVGFRFVEHPLSTR